MGGFHDGELAVQERAGVRYLAQRLGPMLAPPNLSGGAGRFLAGRDLAVITARDHAGQLWTSPLVAHAGFLDGYNALLHVNALPHKGDPLHDLPAGQQIGMVAIDFAARRRMRVNGVLTRVDGGLHIEVEQAYGNCPQHINPDHRLPPAPHPSLTDRAALIGAADTFFLGTIHPFRGADASHRGGEPGFVHLDGDDLWWDDLPGNNMFNSLGNITANDEAALLFLDFDTGARLHLSGRAEIEWNGTDRRVRFRVAAKK
ncbi:MAG TPA: pyridoxamine 5'-phosphate oxidase family protein [Kutzneria sp.]|nr:pyridoxamine 5'-phosphate oxidase family protein [Kutzneria sp.]